ncbi:HEPN domain-containing protein [Bradyrhizobium sp. dw_78]|uniref:HEPN domain-containing protein n=1 Tax=Bradyrhizobium sp. dw_78 TaxID=2719793 RepID=UPI001BD4ADEF|nr:HEPN domain-containing protein [Bradyrhizobium sp. dw_78]
MVKAPPIDERRFLELTRNFSKVSNDMNALGFSQTSADLTEFGHHVGLCWLKLAIRHLADASASQKKKGSRRAVFSRSYYAVYNASKAVRYVVNGTVSLRGDDHQKAVELPDDFPNVDNWSVDISRLREHRLMADYDGWEATASEFSLTSKQSLSLARSFIAEARKYLENKYGIRI